MSAFIATSAIWIASSGIVTILRSYFDSRATGEGAPTLFFERTYGLATIAVAVAVVLYSNTLGLEVPKSIQRLFNSQIQDNSEATESSTSKKSHHTTIFLTTYHALYAFYTYTLVTARETSSPIYSNYSSRPGYYQANISWVVSSLLFFWGVLALVFRGENKFSRTTGADKRTSNFPFRNEKSARSQRRELRERVKGGRKGT